MQHLLRQGYYEEADIVASYLCLIGDYRLHDDDRFDLRRIREY